MKLIIGGSSSGKLDYVRRKFHITDEMIWDYGETEAEIDPKTVRVVNNLNVWAREMFDKSVDYEQTSQHIIKKFGECIIITDEIGNGIVPIDENERKFREWIGRVQIILAENSDEVIRVICGIGQKIK